MNVFEMKEGPMDVDYLAISYAAYAVLSASLTVFLARILSRNGRVFVKAAFGGDPEFADALNNLLVVGFYLINLGWAALNLTGHAAGTPRAAIEQLSQKLGSLLLTLALMHFANVWIFHRIRKHANAPLLRAPLAANAELARS
jgi:hypothetical protein